MYVHWISVLSIGLCFLGIGLILGSNWMTANTNEWLEENNMVIVKNNTALHQCYIDYRLSQAETFDLDKIMEKNNLSFNYT